MSVVRGFGLNGAKLFTNVVTPQEVWCNFIVDSANGNGFGTRSLKSNGYIESVFMYTSATPGTVNGQTNPITVAGGLALVTFKNNFNYYLGGFSGQIVPVTSPTTTSTTAGHAYVITALGTTTLAQWQAAGVPPGFTPAVGLAFVAKATGAIGGTGDVGLPGVQTATSLVVVGDPNQTIANANVAGNAGAKILVQFMAATNSSTTTLVSAAPADGTVVGMQFCFDRSSVTIDGL
jgi:hypothetical protein